MRVTLYVRDEDPATAAAILRERARLLYEGRVYVKPYTRRWPGGMAGARRAIARRKDQKGALIPFRRARKAA